MASSSEAGDGERKVRVVTYNLKDPDTEVVVQCDMTEAEYVEHKAQRDRKSQESRDKAMAAVKKQLEANGGSDILKLKADQWPHPGRKELRASLASVTAEWRTVRIDSLYMLVPTGKPPSNSPESEQEALLEQALVVPSMVPVLWLEMHMRRLCVRKELAEKTTFYMGRKAVMSSSELMWMHVVAYHNGFVKTLWELLKYAQ